jgi:septum formation protein
VTRGGEVTFVLASSSTGRLAVLRNAGIDPEVIVSGVDENTEPGLDTPTIVAALAERKAAAVVAGIAEQHPDALVLGCDSMLDFAGVAYGKPASAQAAADLWRQLSGREGTLFTGHCLIRAGSGARACGVGRTVVRFGSPSPAELDAYIATSEPLAMAGAFSLDGLGGAFVEGIDGDAGNVIGLSLPLLRRLLTDFGVAITDLWRTGSLR